MMIVSVPMQRTRCIGHSAQLLTVVFFPADDVTRHSAYACANQRAFCSISALVTDHATCCCAAESTYGSASSSIRPAAARAGQQGARGKNDARKGSDFHFHSVVNVVTHKFYVTHLALTTRIS